MKTINIGKDYSETPLGRYRDDGDYNGERFREEFLKPALAADQKVIVEIDDVEGYGSSFLDEAFGGLVREGYFNPAQLKQKLEIRSSNPDFGLYRELIWKYITEAKPRKKV
jgi:hypothetical protein